MSALRRVLARGGVIGGSSAGAQVFGEFLVRGNPKTNDELTNPDHLVGFGLLPVVVVDAHFRDRNRTAGFGGPVARHPQLLGIRVASEAVQVRAASLSR
jgi:cyanophycinase